MSLDFSDTVRLQNTILDEGVNTLNKIKMTSLWQQVFALDARSNAYRFPNDSNLSEYFKVRLNLNFLSAFL